MLDIMGILLLLFDVCSDEKDQWFSLGMKDCRVQIARSLYVYYLMANRTGVSNEHIFPDNK